MMRLFVEESVDSTSLLSSPAYEVLSIVHRQNIPGQRRSLPLGPVNYDVLKVVTEPHRPLAESPHPTRDSMHDFGGYIFVISRVASRLASA